MNPWRMLIWLLIAQILIAFIGRGVSPLGVFIGESLQLTNAQIGMLPAALFFGQFVASIPFGVFVDRVGTRRLLLVLTLVLGISFSLVSFATPFWLVLVLMAIGGVGYGAYHPVSTRGILYWFDSLQRGTAMGIKQMGVTVGSALAAFLLVPLSEMFHWRPVLFVSSLVLIIGGLICYYYYRDAVVSMPKTKNARISKQLLSMFAHRRLLLLTIGAMTLSASQMSLNTYLILYATNHLLVSIVFAGMLLVISEVGGSLGRVIWGMVSDRLFQGNRMIILCMIATISTLGFVTLATLSEGVNLVVLVLIIFVLGFCLAGYNGLWMNAATEIVPKEQAGLSSGFSTSIGAWGVILGPPLFGLIADVTGSYSASWIVMAVLMFFVAILFLFLNQSLRKKSIDT